MLPKKIVQGRPAFRLRKNGKQSSYNQSVDRSLQSQQFLSIQYWFQGSS